MTALVHIHIGKTSVSAPPGLIRGDALRECANLSTNSALYLDIRDEIDIPVGSEDWLLLRGGEHFAVGDHQNGIEDNPCLRVPLRIHFNSVELPADKALHRPKLTGAELRQLDPHANNTFRVASDIEGLPDEYIADGQRIIVQPKDRFITVPCGNVGDGDLLADHLSQVQAEYGLASLVVNGNSRYLVVPNYKLPPGWSRDSSDLLIIVPNGYPMAPLDMFYLERDVTLSGGREAGGSAQIELHLGKSWRRFSWHYTDGTSAWLPNRSTLKSHMQFSHSRLLQLA